MPPRSAPAACKQHTPAGSALTSWPHAGGRGRLRRPLARVRAVQDAGPALAPEPAQRPIHAQAAGGRDNDDARNRTRPGHLRRRHPRRRRQPLPQAQVIRNVVAEAVLADEVGVDFIGVGEHHRADFAVSAPEVVLAAIAGRTDAHPARLRRHGAQLRRPGARLPALLDARRRVGRPGRGHPRPRLVHRVVPALRLRPRRSTRRCSRRSSTCSPRCSRPHGRPVTWQGTTRAAARGPARLPDDRARPLTTWVGVGGSPESVVRAARYGLPLMLAIIGGDPRRFAPVRRPLPPRPRRARQADAADRRPLARPHRRHRRSRRATSSGPHWRDMRDRIGAERGWRPDEPRPSSSARSSTGSLYVGSPETVARKIAATAAGPRPRALRPEVQRRHARRTSR